MVDMWKRKCAVGRTVTRPSPYKDLDCRTPCLAPATESLPFTPPMYLCPVHYRVVADDLWEALADWIDDGIVG